MAREVLAYEDDEKRVWRAGNGTWSSERIEWKNPLAGLLADATTTGRVTLRPGVTYTVPADLTVDLAGVTIDGRAATLRLLGTLILAGNDQRLDEVTVTGTHGVKIDGDRCGVHRCRFVTETDVAVFVTGDDIRITDNHVAGSGITYSWAGSSGALVAGNTVTDAPLNGLSGTGNNEAAPNVGAVVVDNVVIRPGRMGIEDWGNTRRSIIRGNRVEASAGIGISAVGAGPVVEGNTVADAVDYGIEVSGNGPVVRGNTVTFTASPAQGAGIVVNGTSGTVEAGALVDSNSVHRPHVGVEMAGSLTVVAVTGNTVTDAAQRAYSLEPLAAEAIVCTGNIARFNTPAESPLGFRDGIAIGRCRAVNVTGNVLAYTLASAGPAWDFAIRPTADTSVIVANTVDGGGRSDGNGPVVTGNGATPIGVVFADNALVGGATDGR